MVFAEIGGVGGGRVEVPLDRHTGSKPCSLKPAVIPPQPANKSMILRALTRPSCYYADRQPASGAPLLPWMHGRVVGFLLWESGPACGRINAGTPNRNRAPFGRSCAWFRYRVSVRPLKVSVGPLIFLYRPKVAVFLDGCFWHGCPEHHTVAVTNAEFSGPRRSRQSRLGTVIPNADWPKPVGLWCEFGSTRTVDRPP